jgi:hypothetical protein
LNKARIALYLGVVFLLAVCMGLIAGIIMDFLGSESADTLKAGGGDLPRHDVGRHGGDPAVLRERLL